MTMILVVTIIILARFMFCFFDHSPRFQPWDSEYDICIALQWLKPLAMFF